MPEEGPEPQEFLESVEHNLHEKHPEDGEHEDAHAKSKAKHMRSAITAAVLAVLAALGSLLSGHAANEAILLQTKASDQWSYYQATSTKLHLYEVNKTLVEALAKANVTASSQTPLTELTSSMTSKMKNYAREKKDIEDKATGLEKESEHEFAQHQMYSFAVACFQIAIVIASVSILVESSVLYQSSVVGGVVGLLLLVVGFIK